MSGRCFIDTNVWIYAATGKFSEPRKHGIARELIAMEDFAVSAQIIGEFFVNVQKKKMKFPLTYAETMEWVDRLSVFPCVELDLNIARTASANVGRYRVQYFDSALLAQAERYGASVFYSEDMNHGQLYGTVRVQNPFLEH